MTPIRQQYRSYQEYLRQPHWKSIRRKIHKTRDRCQSCGSKEHLDIHHNKGYENIGHEKLSELKLYCRQCHYWEHERQKGFGNIRPSYIIHWVGCWFKRMYMIG